MTLVGTTVRHIRIVGQLGEGGMGEVYLGEDERLGRKVAVKAIRADRRLDAGAKARLLREARVLSQLEHPNICRIYEYIEGDDADLLVLELVEGRGLREVLADELDRGERLAIAEQVADALVAAHGLSVVHRDLKPENIMVTDQGVAKVLDFGIARALRPETDSNEPTEPIHGTEAPGSWATDGSLSGTTLPPEQPSSSGGDVQSPDLTLTELGDVVGTPRYMSPEQARGERVTAASDMFSFGLLLQELVTGEAPYSVGLDGSALVKKARWADTLPVRGVEAPLADLIRRLQEVSPAERPGAVETAQRLVWIRDRPRRRLRRLAVAAVALGLVAGAAMLAVGLVQTRSSLTEVQQAKAESDAVVDFLGDMLASADPAKAGIDARVVDVLDDAAARLDEGFADHPLRRATLALTLGSTYLAIGDLRPAREHMEIALEIRERELGKEHPDTVSALHGLGKVLHRQGETADAEAVFRDVLEHRLRQLDENHEAVSGTRRNLANVLLSQGRFEQAESMYRQVLASNRDLLGPEHPDTLAAANGLAIALLRLGRYEEAAQQHQQTLDTRRRVHGPDHPTTLSSMSNLAVVLVYLGQEEDAEALFRDAAERKGRIFGPEHLETLSTWANLAMLLQRMGRHPEAEPILREVIEIQRRTLGEEHPDTLITLSNVAEAMAWQGKLALAEQQCREVLAAKARVFGEEHPSTLATASSLAWVVFSQERYAEAETMYRDLLRRQRVVHGENHPRALWVMLDLAAVIGARGRIAEAEALMLEVQGTADGELDPNDPVTRRAEDLLAQLAKESG